MKMRVSGVSRQGPSLEELAKEEEEQGARRQLPGIARTNRWWVGDRPDPHLLFQEMPQSDRLHARRRVAADAAERVPLPSDDVVTSFASLWARDVESWDLDVFQAVEGKLVLLLQRRRLPCGRVLPGRWRRPRCPFREWLL